MTQPSDANAADDLRWMSVAQALARRSLGRAWPNPAVGCVIIGDGALVGRGWTQIGGRPHAETVALAQAADAARGATVYVTLEPCAHHGVTPPCAEALIKAGVARVVSGLGDPDERVSGRGHQMLRNAGVGLTTGVLSATTAELNLGYLRRQSAGMPMLTLKLAATLDGRIATASGESQWITGEPARARAHLLRATHDAILIGSGTAQADDPRLDVRLPGLATTSPVRVVADTELRTPPDGQLARTTPERPLWLLHAEDAPLARRTPLETIGARLLPVARSPAGGLDPRGMLRALGGQGVTRVLCEGGGRMAASLIGAGLVDRLIWAAAGVVIGADGVGSTGPLALLRLADAPRFELISMEPVGADLWSEWRPAA